MTKSDGGVTAEWQEARQRAAVRARRLWPLALYLFVLVAVTIAVSDGLRPLLLQVREWRGATTPDRVSPWAVASWLGVQGVRAAPALALAAAIWQTAQYLKQVGAGELWNVATARLLRRVGALLLLGAALWVLVVPTLLGWLEARGGIGFDLSTVAVALGVLGGLLIVVADLLGDVLRTAGDLKAESDSFV